ncbi:MAG TPA: Asp-tRNA(Asn)/Glu-tRNA(Gln) amidotransferase subunit GatB [Coxiellaceae bacterium]|nr:Asp-tRNA(Asn)/Glu-tRNA(Gln) amidotransferase subunit GatB [Coxiellaceae bacterium]
MKWETIIGLEVHVQLATHSKIFSGASTQFGADPNTQACAIDLGFPGVLPVLNKKAVEYAIKLGLAVGATIATRSIFARKNYFYPDLPKGYQISQNDLPVVQHGFLMIPTDKGEKRIGITRAHLEEDAGKSLHEDLGGLTGIDLNRAGTPLLEIVSEPDIRSPAEAVVYLKTLHTLVRYLGISDANMQEGSFRCDVNVSVRPEGQGHFGTRTETKNVNSFRFVERAILFEVTRQIEVLENGGEIIQETRLYNPDRDETKAMRSKENAHDYRYFPDPDLLPLEISSDWIESVRQTLPELPQEKSKRFKEAFGLSDYDANYLTSSLDIANYFEAALKVDEKIPPKLIANWIAGDLSALLNKENRDIMASPVSPEALTQLIVRIVDNTISNSMAKQVFEKMWAGVGSADAIIEQEGLKQISDSGALEKIIDEVIANNPEQLAQYRSGKDKLFAFFVGQIMKATQGRANPQQVNDLLKSKLS